MLALPVMTFQSELVNREEETGSFRALRQEQLHIYQLTGTLKLVWEVQHAAPGLICKKANVLSGQVVTNFLNVESEMWLQTNLFT